MGRSTVTERELSTLDRRTRIIETTTELFLEKGFAGTSMSAIAKACGITKASLYHHFKGKDDLFSACVTHGYTAVLSEIENIIENKDIDPSQKLSKAIKILYDITIRSNVGRMSPLIAEVSRKFSNVAQSFYTEYIEPERILIWKIIEEGIALGDFKPVDQKQFFHITFGPMVMLSLSREMFASFEDLDEHFPVDDLRDGHVVVLSQILKNVRH